MATSVDLFRLIRIPNCALSEVSACFLLYVLLVLLLPWLLPFHILMWHIHYASSSPNVSRISERVQWLSALSERSDRNERDIPTLHLVSILDTYVKKSFHPGPAIKTRLLNLFPLGMFLSNNMMCREDYAAIAAKPLFTYSILLLCWSLSCVFLTLFISKI